MPFQRLETAQKVAVKLWRQERTSGPAHSLEWFSKSWTFDELQLAGHQYQPENGSNATLNSPFSGLNSLK
jgi:hypothetical protein